MNILARLFAVLLTVLPAHPAFSQGPLTPPGAPAPTMKSLDQLEAKLEKRIPIDAVNTPGAGTDQHVISQPGSYYLTGNLAVTLTDGIQVSAPDVTVDLNGFQVRRTEGSGGVGINISSDSLRVVVRNGSVAGSFDVGVRGVPGLVGARFQHLAVTNCGVGFIASDNAQIENCTAHDNVGTGIRAGNGSVVTKCVADNNGGIGIQVVDSSTVTNCTATRNRGEAGIKTGSGGNISNCTARLNVGSDATSGGIVAGGHSTITNCTSSLNASGFATPTSSSGTGISIGSGSTVINCTAVSNKGNGIAVPGGGCFITGNTASFNGLNGNAAGIYVTSLENRIEGNHATGNDRGFDIANGGNLIMKNSAKANGPSNNLNYVIVAENRFGPVVNLTASQPLGMTGNASAGTLNDGAGGSHPWANFAY